MASSKLSVLAHLKQLALRSRAYFTESLAEVSTAVADALEEIDNTKADTEYVDEAISKLSGTAPVLSSSTEGSTKKFELTVDDTGRLGVKEIE